MSGLFTIPTISCSYSCVVFPIIRRGFPTICVLFSNYRCTVFLRLTHQHFHSGVKEDLAFRIRFLLILAYLHSVCGVWLLLKVHIPPLKRLNDIQEHDYTLLSETAPNILKTHLLNIRASKASWERKASCCLLMSRCIHTYFYTFICLYYHYKALHILPEV